MSQTTSTSKYLSLILRHKPEAVGITLDGHGWAHTAELIHQVNQTHPLTMELLEEIVRTDEKQRFSFNEDKTKIRANQGHSIPVDVEMEEGEPPELLYHGTGEKYVASILKQGLLPKSRLYVHLSTDTSTARKVGSRHGNPMIFLVQAGQMYRDGYVFRYSENGIWMTKQVPVSYLILLDKWSNDDETNRYTNYR
ncbi:MAG: RNA 2'-phosphotransferase [Solobacterium sp.]|nr:RNA 2'-phosphotransferase [Solobacterium sp.]